MMRTADLTLARVHLRLGCLALARAELESLAGRDELDDAGMVDLAEARWRTGDIAGAGEVASAVLGDGDDGPLITLVVAAEAALARGRPTEARRYSTRALEEAAGRIDDVFAGMPRGPVWPTDSTTLRLPPPTLFDVPAVELAPVPGLGLVVDGTAPETIASTDAAGPEAPGSPEPNTIALWDAGGPESDLDEAPWAPASVEPSPVPTEPQPGPVQPVPPQPAQIEAGPDTDAGGDAFLMGADALDRGDVRGASAQLALALRLSPALAPSVLEVIDGRTDRELAFVRGDAYRLVGRETDARRAFADAVNLGDASGSSPGAHPYHQPDDPTDHAPEGDPA
jgi:hypothetical protein